MLLSKSCNNLLRVLSTTISWFTSFENQLHSLLLSSFPSSYLSSSLERRFIASFLVPHLRSISELPTKHFLSFVLSLFHFFNVKILREVAPWRESIAFDSHANESGTVIPAQKGTYNDASSATEKWENITTSDAACCGELWAPRSASSGLCKLSFQSFYTHLNILWPWLWFFSSQLRSVFLFFHNRSFYCSCSCFCGFLRVDIIALWLQFHFLRLRNGQRCQTMLEIPENLILRMFLDPLRHWAFFSSPNARIFFLPSFARPRNDNFTIPHQIAQSIFNSGFHDRQRYICLHRESNTRAMYSIRRNSRI